MAAFQYKALIVTAVLLAVTICVVYMGGQGSDDLARTNVSQVSQKSSGTATSGKLFSGKQLRKWQGQKERSVAQLKWDDVFASTADCDPKQPFVAVVTTISQSPTKAILQLAASRPDVNVIVVADKKSPLKWENIPSNIHYFTVAAQQQKYSSSFMPPWNHFGRKNIGYLEALSSRACFIWDFDDDNILFDEKNGVLNLQNLQKWSRTATEVTATREAEVPSVWVNVLPLMGNTRFIWPRGSPLEPLQQTTTFLPPLRALEPCANAAALPAGCVPIGKQCSCLGLLSTLAQGNPDLDAIQRLTGSSDVRFQRELGSMVALGPRTTASHNAQATLISRAAIILGMLPMTVHGRVSDIWRAVILNRLSELYGLRVAVTSGTVEHIRNPHSFLGDLDAEQPLYAQANVLGEILAAWQPSDKSSVGSTVLELYIYLYEVGVLDAADVEYAQKWLLAAAAALRHNSAGAARQLRNNPLVQSARLPRSAAADGPVATGTFRATVAAAVRVRAADMEGIPSWLAIYSRFYTRVVVLLSGSSVCSVPSLPSSFPVSVVCDTGDAGVAVHAAADNDETRATVWPGALAAMHGVSQTGMWAIVDINAAVHVDKLNAEVQKQQKQGFVQQEEQAMAQLQADGASVVYKGGDARLQQVVQRVNTALKGDAAARRAMQACSSKKVPLDGSFLAVQPGGGLKEQAMLGKRLQDAGVAPDVAVAIALACNSQSASGALHTHSRMLSVEGLWQHAQLAPSV